MPPHINEGSQTRQRIRKPPQTLPIPDIQEDAAERKRVLNVLAQRRYRQRKRESRAQVHKVPHAPAQNPVGAGHKSLPGSGDAGDVLDLPLFLPGDIDLGLAEIHQLGNESLNWLTSSPDDVAISYPIHASNETGAQPPLFPDTIYKTPNSTVPALTSSPPSTNNDTHSESTSSSGSDSTSFPDSYLLVVPPLTLLRGLLRIASRLNSASSVWSFTATSPFNLGLGPDASQLPAAWQPTSTQLSVPHHPLLDLFPWPAVRDRMIGVMSLANESVHETSTGSNLVDFIYDMEDSGDGVRIWGADPFDEANWEVGQVVFERWWFVFDKSVVEQSNGWRRERGAVPLRALSR